MLKGFRKRLNRKKQVVGQGNDFPVDPLPDASDPLSLTSSLSFDIDKLMPYQADVCLDEIISMAHNERLLIAGEYLTKLRVMMKSNPDDSTVKHARDRMLGEFQPDIEQLEKRVVETRKALHDFQDSGSWIFGQEHFGITTSYRTGEDGTLWIKLEGRMEGVSILDQAAVVLESDLYKSWAPFCNNSAKLKEEGWHGLLAYFRLHLPFALISRDCVLHGYAVDAAEEGSALIIGKSVEEWRGADIPPIASGGLGVSGARMNMRSFKCLMTADTPTDGHVLVITNIDPKVNLPQAMIDFVMKKIAGLILYLLQKQAKKISANPSCDHAKAMRARPQFYDSRLKSVLTRYLEINGKEGSSSSSERSESSDAYQHSRSSSNSNSSSSCSSTSSSSSRLLGRSGAAPPHTHSGVSPPSPSHIRNWLLDAYSGCVVWPLLQLLPLLLWGWEVTAEVGVEAGAEVSGILTGSSADITVPAGVMAGPMGAEGWGGGGLSASYFVGLVYNLIVHGVGAGLLGGGAELVYWGLTRPAAIRAYLRFGGEMIVLTLIQLGVALSSVVLALRPLTNAPSPAGGPSSKPVSLSSTSTSTLTSLGDTPTRRPFRSTRKFALGVTAILTLLFCFCVGLVSAGVALAATSTSTGEVEEEEWEKVASSTAAAVCWGVSLVAGCVLTGLQVNRRVMHHPRAPPRPARTEDATSSGSGGGSGGGVSKK